MESIVATALGEEGFRRLAAAFYRRVRFDDLVGPLYPEADWDGAEDRLASFLLFRFGLDETYLRERGHPRLRMRHLPYAIGEAERDRWLTMMEAAMDEIALEGEAREALSQFFQEVADFMRNRD
jgi:hemoglobin